MAENKELKEKADKKISKDGWIRCSMFIEVLAGSEEAAKGSLESHVRKMEKEDKVMIYKKGFGEIKTVEKPLPSVPVGYSNIVEIEMAIANLDKLVFMAMNYGPTNIEILEPNTLKVGAGEAQGLVNSVADLVHQFARIGAGGIVINR